MSKESIGKLALALTVGLVVIAIGGTLDALLTKDAVIQVDLEFLTAVVAGAATNEVYRRLES